MGNLLEGWLSFLAAVGGVGVVAGGIGAFVGKILSDRLAARQKAIYDQELEQHKAALTRDLETLRHGFTRQVETAKAQLLILSQERQTRFAALHEKRAAMLAEFHTLLEDAYQHTSLLTFRAQKQGPEKARNAAREVFHKCAKVTSFFNQNKLYFSSAVASQLEELLKTITKPSSDFFFAAVSGAPDESVEKALQEWLQSRAAIPEALRALEHAFRCMLGSDDTSLRSGTELKAV